MNKLEKKKKKKKSNFRLVKEKGKNIEI